jgi:O-antigen/teichoic acid export membrane protein
LSVLARKSFLIFLTNIAGAGLGVISLFFVGRFFDPGPYGMFWFGVSLLGLLGALTKLGFEKAHERQVARGTDLATCMGTYVRIKLIIIITFVSLALSLILIRQFTVGWIAATTFSVMLVVVLYNILIKLRGTIKVSLDALRLTASTQSIMLIENVTRLPLVILVTLAFAFSRDHGSFLEGAMTWVRTNVGSLAPMSDETGAVLYALAYTAAILASAIWAVVLLRRHRIPLGHYDPSLAREYWSFAWPVATFMIFTSMANHIDIVMLGYFWTGDEVGFYRAAFQFVAIVTIIPTAVRTLFFPMISELIAKQQWGAVKDLALTTQRMMSLVMIPILMLTLLYAEDVFRIVMSLTWTPSAPVLRLLVLNTLLVVFATVIMNILLAEGRVKIVMAVSLAGFFLNVGLNFVFIPSSILGVQLLGLQMTGAALATVVSKVAVLIIFITLGKKLLGSFFLTWSIPKQVFAATFAGSALWALEHFVTWFQVVRVWELAMASMIGVALYIGILFAIRELGRKDMLFFLDLVNPGEMRRYIKDELKRK